MFRLFSLSFIVLPVALTPVEAKRVALVIGNNDYANLPVLKKATNDAQAIRDMLKAKGFDVLYAENINLADFKKQIFDFSAKIANDDIVVFYYAGHGVALNGANYLIPTDVPKPVFPDPDHPENINEDDIRSEQERLAEFSVKESLVLGQIANRKPKVSVMILDSCRNNPLRLEAGDSPFRDAATGDVVFGSPTNTREQRQPEGMIIVYSASFGQTALDLLPGKEEARNSPFTTALLENFKTPGLGLKQVIQKTREDVFQLAKSINHNQSPAVYDQLFGGDVYLSGEPAKDGQVKVITDPLPLDSLAADFEFARTLNSKLGWELFLARHGTKSDMRVDVANQEKGKMALLDIPVEEKSDLLAAGGACLITKNNTNPFFVKMKEGAEKGAAAAGVTLQSFAGEKDGDAAPQITAIENCVASGVKGILITPSNDDVGPALKAARAKGILVISLDTPLGDPEGWHSSALKVIGNGLPWAVF